MKFNKLIFIGRRGALMRSMPNGNIVIVNREFIRDISATKTFLSQGFSLNPGLASTFPWLSQIADSYEEYRIRGLVFQFKSTSTPYLANQKSLSLGTVIMAAQYNVNNPRFTNKRDMENYIGATSGSPLTDQLFVVRPDSDPLKVLYLRQGTPTEVDYDLRFYDYGRFELGTIGMTVDDDPTISNFCGELWVNYEIELIKPRLRDNVGRLDHFMLTPSALYNVSITKPFGTNLITRLLPAPPSGRKNNGWFQYDTYIQPSTGGKSMLVLQETMANQTFKITIALWSAAGSPIVATITDEQDITATIPTSVGIIQSTSLYGPFWSRVGLNSGSNAPSGGDANYVSSSSRYIWSWIVTLGDMSHRNDSQGIEFVFTKTPAANTTEWYYDVIIEKVNLASYNYNP